MKIFSAPSAPSAPLRQSFLFCYLNVAENHELSTAQKQTLLGLRLLNDDFGNQTIIDRLLRCHPIIAVNVFQDFL